MTLRVRSASFIAIVIACLCAVGTPSTFAASNPSTTSCTDPVGDGEVEDAGPSSDHPAEDLVGTALTRGNDRLQIAMELAGGIPSEAPVLADGTSDSILYYVETAVDKRGNAGNPTYQIGVELLVDGWHVYAFDFKATRQRNFSVEPLINGSKLTVSIPTKKLSRLGSSFFWHSGTETYAGPEGIRVYQDRCPGGAGAVAPPNEWVRAT